METKEKININTPLKIGDIICGGAVRYKIDYINSKFCIRSGSKDGEYTFYKKNTLNDLKNLLMKYSYFIVKNNIKLYQIY